MHIAAWTDHQVICSCGFFIRDAHDVSADERYDYIVSRTTFHHLDNIPKMLQTLQGMVNPGGRIAILDCMSNVETPPRWSYLLGAYLECPTNLVTLGFSSAHRIFPFRRSHAWLDHLATDHYLSEEAFAILYEQHFPGCIIIKRAMFSWCDMGEVLCS